MDESSSAGGNASGGKQSTAGGLTKFVNGHTAVGEGDITRPYSAILGGLGRFGPLYRRIYFT